MRASRTTLTRVAILFGEHGVKERVDRLRLCADHAGRHLSSSSELTELEALRLVARLEALPDGAGLRRRLAELVADEENDAALRAASSSIRLGVDVARPGESTVIVAQAEGDGQLTLLDP